MPAKKDSAAAADSRPEAEGFVQTVLDRTYALQVRKEELQKERAENRQTVRLLRSQGALTPEQVKWCDEVYPPRKAQDEDESKSEKAA